MYVLISLLVCFGSSQAVTNDWTATRMFSNNLGVEVFIILICTYRM